MRGWQCFVETLAELIDVLAAGKIKSIVAARIPLAKAATAKAQLERGSYAGKVVLVTKIGGKNHD